MHFENTAGSPDFDFNDTLPEEYPVTVAFIDLSKVYKNVHWHDNFEIDIVNNGKLEIQTNEALFTVSAGQGILLNQNVVHSLRTVPDESQSDACTVYSVHFRSSFLFSYEQPFLSGKYRDIIIASPNLQAVVLDESVPWCNEVLETVNNLIAANLTKRFGYEILSRGYLCQLWALLLRKVNPSAAETQKPVQTLDSERVRRAITYMETHYAEQLALEDIAAHIHLSKSECCRCFKRNLRLTPFEYLMRYRIYIASRKIIENPDLKSFSELGFSVGFNNSSYFNKIFRQYLNCTPTQYRKKVKEASANGRSSFRPYRF